MSVQPSFCKAARHARRSSTGHGGAHPNAHRSSPIRRSLIAFDAAHRPFNDNDGVVPLAASIRTPSASSPAALKSPRACRTSSANHARSPPLGAFGRRPPNTPRCLSCGRHPKPFTPGDIPTTAPLDALQPRSSRTFNSAGRITRSPRSAISCSKEGYLYVSRTQG